MKKVQFTTVIPVHVLCFHFVDVFRNNEYEYATTKTVVGYKNTVKLTFNLHYNLSLILGQNWNAHINVHPQIAKECLTVDSHYVKRDKIGMTTFLRYC